MLDVLRVTNFTIVDTVELVCGPGLNVLTGETGAGKSIIVDALNLLLGARGSANLVRPGARQAEIEGIFDLTDSPEALAVLDEYDLPADEQLVLRRVLTAAGKSRAYINGRLVPLTTLAALRTTLCDFHGQHEHQSLLRPAFQLQLLDDAADLEQQRKDMANLARRLQDAQAKLRELQEQQQTKAQRIEMLREDLERFGSVELREGIEEEWRRERSRLANAEELRHLLMEADHALSESGDDVAGVGDLLGVAVRALRKAAEFDEDLREQISALAGAQDAIDDVSRTLQLNLESLESDPATLDTIEQSLHALARLQRRYGVASVAELLELQQATAQELAELEDMDTAVAAAKRERDAARREAETAAQHLSKVRRKAAAALQKTVSKDIRQLGMPDGALEIHIEQDAAPDGEVEVNGKQCTLRLTGVDRVTIAFSANAGQPLRPLREVASGGELSRVMLALKAVQAGTIPLLVFDEIDAGIGGNVGVAVADKLAALSAQRQVFCVTHLPQIASRAHTQWRVEKLSDGRSTSTRVTEVRDAERAREIARMFGDTVAESKALEHAEALLSRSG